MEQIAPTQHVNRAERRSPGWDRFGAAMGLAYVVLQLASQALIQTGGTEPAFDAPGAEIATFFAARNPALTAAGGFLSLLSLVAFTWFLGVLWARLRAAEGGAGWLSLVAFGSGLLAMSVLLAGGGWELAILRVEDGLAPETARLLFDAGNHSFANFWVALAALLLPAAVITLRDRALPRWLGWLGLVTALALLAVRPVWFTAGGIKFLPYMLFWVWLIGASIALMRRQT